MYSEGIQCAAGQVQATRSLLQQGAVVLRSIMADTVADSAPVPTPDVAAAAADATTTAGAASSCDGAATAAGTGAGGAGAGAPADDKKLLIIHYNDVCAWLTGAQMPCGQGHSEACGG